jgi:hypothetical protein
MFGYMRNQQFGTWDELVRTEVGDEHHPAHAV